VYVALDAPAEVAALTPDLSRLAALGSTAFSVFAPSGQAWKCRVFAPGEGIAEDPATGAAAGPLAVHLARHGRIAFGDEIVIEQGAEIGRPSILHARATGDRDRIDAVEVGGHAVIVGAGTFRLP
jgi:trans-2,3-dihydro-3-hydroxyanthranilate isomerase